MRIVPRVIQSNQMCACRVVLLETSVSLLWCGICGRSLTLLLWLIIFADDDSNILTVESNQGPVLTKTTWTLLLYLTSATEGCQGGETVFFPNDRRVAKEEVAVPPETGMALLHKHGNDCMLVGPSGDARVRYPDR